ncbi:RAMP superfamily CRISPR-associated protein [Vibrio metschnikovii]
MSSLNFCLRFDLRSEWHVGTGREGGAYADSLVLKDQHALPMLSGKSIKGLLRQAFHEALELEWLKGADNQTLTQLFGCEGVRAQAQGALRISSATLSAAEIAYFTANPKDKGHLYLVRHATAIDSHTGAAKEGSLRAMETVVPLVLHAQLELNNASAEIQQQFAHWLSIVLPLINSVGGKRRRGLGDVIVTVEEQ